MIGGGMLGFIMGASCSMGRISSCLLGTSTPCFLRVSSAAFCAAYRAAAAATESGLPVSGKAVPIRFFRSFGTAGVLQGDWLRHDPGTTCGIGFARVVWQLV